MTSPRERQPGAEASPLLLHCRDLLRDFFRPPGMSVERGELKTRDPMPTTERCMHKTPHFHTNLSVPEGTATFLGGLCVSWELLGACRPQILARMTPGSPRLLQAGLCPAAEEAMGPSQPRPRPGGRSHLLSLKTTSGTVGPADPAGPVTCCWGLQRCGLSHHSPAGTILQRATGAVPWLPPHPWSPQHQ